MTLNMYFLVAVLHIVMGVYSYGNVHHCKFHSKHRFLNCSCCELSAVPVNENHFNESLTIDLSYNNISEVRDSTFINASELQHLDLSNNTIHTFEPSSFEGLRKLKYLDLSQNKFNLTTDIFTSKLFTPLESLQEIRIQRYENPDSLSWKGIDTGFGQLTNLEKLFFDLPKDFNFGEGFRKLTKLTTISTSGPYSTVNVCSVGTLTNNTFDVFRNIAINELRLIKCGIYHIESGAFDPLKSLTVLDLTYNPDLGLHKALYSLRSLQHRNMTEITFVVMNNASCYDSKNFVLEANDFRFLKNICVKKVDLSLNYIAFIEDSLIPKFDIRCLEKFNMSFHSLRCLPLNFFRSLQTCRTLKSLDYSHGYASPETRGYHLPMLLPLVINSPIELPPNLSSLNVSSGGLWVNFDLLFTNASKLRYFDISFLYISNCHRPMIFGLENLKHIAISGIRCETIHPSFFHHFRKIKSLSLSRSDSIRSAVVSPTLPFSLLKHLENLNLYHCKIKYLNPRLFLNNKRLRQINLSKNKLQRLPTAISHLTKLQVLDLSRNDISHLHSDEIKILQRWMTKKSDSHSFKLLLHGNPLQCTCETVLFIRWILENKSYLDNKGDYKCFLSNGARVSVLRFGETLKDFEVRCISRTYLIISVVGSLAAVLVIVVFAGIYRYRLNLRYWLYTRLKPPTNMFMDHEYIYDAFVGYTSEDLSWVYNDLRLALESRFQLCLHDRDFIPGKHIHENIVDKIRESRKILLVISNAFLESTYGPLEIEYAGMKCLEEGRDDVILCVMMEDIAVRQMPKALRNLWHKITFIKWKSEPEQERIFWRNLTTALSQDNQ